MSFCLEETDSIKPQVTPLACSLPLGDTMRLNYFKPLNFNSRVKLKADTPPHIKTSYDFN